jgi:putative redox protein
MRKRLRRKMPVETSTKLRWTGGLKFDVEVAEGRKIELNSADEMAHAFTPMELFLVSLAGCTAMDIQWIMSRQRQKLQRLEVSASGTRRDDDPRYYERINLEYTIAGQNIKKNAVERAIRLSQEKYCSVKAMIKDNVKLNISYVIANENGAEEKFTYPASASQ